MTLDPFPQHSLTLIPAWISNNMPNKVSIEINWKEWTSNFIPHFIMGELLIHAEIKFNPG